jgi:predicted DNA-binding transcriptional regulator YafY
MADRRPIAVRSLPQAETWLSIAALNWPRVWAKYSAELYVNNGLNLVGHDHRENALRTFAVERIQSAKLTNRRLEIPPDFDFDEFQKTAFNVIWGEPQEVEIRFSAFQAPYIRERAWHPSQQIENESDGSIILTLHVADLDEVKRWLIGFGADADVVKPQELRNEIRCECSQMVKLAGQTI